MLDGQTASGGMKRVEMDSLTLRTRVVCNLRILAAHYRGHGMVVAWARVWIVVMKQKMIEDVAPLTNG